MLLCPVSAGSVRHLAVNLKPDKSTPEFLEFVSCSKQQIESC